jgi:predicted dehydrogenase
LIRHSKLFQSDIDSEISGDLGSIRIASISNLESIKLRMTGKESTDQFASEGNMRHEAEMFHEMIESGRGTRDDLLRSAGVIRVMQNIRLSNGILFPSDSHA